MHRGSLPATGVTLFLILATTVAFGQTNQASNVEGDIFTNPRLGFSFRRPSAAWAFHEEKDVDQGIYHVSLYSETEADVAFTVAAWDRQDGRYDTDFASVRERDLQHVGDYEVHVRSKGTELVDRLYAPFIEYRLTSQEGSWVVREYYVRRDDVCFMIDLRAGEDEWVQARNATRKILESLRWHTPALVEHPPPKEAATKLVLSNPRPGTAAFLAFYAAGQPFSRFDVLTLISTAAKFNNGVPLVLVAQGHLTQDLRDVLEHYRPENLYVVDVSDGTKRPSQPLAAQVEAEYLSTADCLWTQAHRAVVAPRELRWGVVAAPLATKLGCPLFFAPEDRAATARIRELCERLSQLGVREVLAVGSDLLVNRFSRAGFDTRGLRSPAEVAKAIGSFDYVAVANLRELPNGPSYPLLASYLASGRGGVVYPLDVGVEYTFARLEETTERPPGVDLSAMKRYLVGKLEAEGQSVDVAVPVLFTWEWKLRDGALIVRRYGGVQADRDGNGYFDDEGEYLRAATPITIGKKPCLFSTKLMTLMGSELYGHEMEHAVYLLSPNPREIQKELLQFYDRTSRPKYVSIVGDPSCLPFHYRRSSLHTESWGTMEQELATDNPYANVDDDEYLELCVGRIPATTLSSGSAYVARALIYDQVDSEWSSRALLLCPAFPRVEKETLWPQVFPEAEAAFRSIEEEFKLGRYQTTSLYREGATLGSCFPELLRKGLIFFYQHSDQQIWAFGEETLKASWSGKVFPEPPDSVRVLPWLEAWPLIFCGGCISAGLDAGLPLDRTFPVASLERGAIGYIGNTRLGSSGTEAIVRHACQRMIYDEASVGEALRDGKNYLNFLVENSVRGGDIEESYARFLEAENFKHTFFVLNYFGDPAVRLRVPQRPERPVVAAWSFDERDEGTRARITLTSPAQPWTHKVLRSKGPETGTTEEICVVNAHGLTSSGVAFYQPMEKESAQPGLATVFVKLELPDALHSPTLKLRQGPKWSLGPWTVESLEEGKHFLLLHVALLRHDLYDGEYEAAGKVIVELQ